MKTQTRSPGPRSSELVAQRTPPSVHLPREFNAPGRAAIKTRRGSSRDLRRRETLVLVVVVLVPDYLLFRGRGLKSSRERTRRIYMEQCPAIRHDDLEKTCRAQRKTISRFRRSSKRGDPLNCLLTLLSIERLEGTTRGKVDGGLY